MGFLANLLGFQNAMHDVTRDWDGTDDLDLYGIAYEGALEQQAALDQQAASTSQQDQIDAAWDAGDIGTMLDIALGDDDDDSGGWFF